MEILSALAVVALLSSGIGAYLSRGRRQGLKRTLKRYREYSRGDSGLLHLTGHLRLDGDPLEAPVSGDEVACYHVMVGHQQHQAIGVRSAEMVWMMSRVRSRVADIRLVLDEEEIPMKVSWRFDCRDC